jgi:hypothetical protein
MVVKIPDPRTKIRNTAIKYAVEKSCKAGAGAIPLTLSSSSQQLLYGSPHDLYKIVR